MSKLSLLVAIILVAFAQCEYWADEFDSTDAFGKNWIHETGNWGWGNNEWQDYTTTNTKLRNGMLEILSEKTASGYKSARIKSKNSFRYGIFEFRAKLPYGRGTWPAIWLLAANKPLNWPWDGEIDVMEHVGYDQNVVHSTIHCGKYNHMINTQKFGKMYVDKASDDFYVYLLDWSPSRIAVYINGKLNFEFFKDTNADYGSWPFDNYHNIILNTAVGGNWGGAMGADESVFPQTFYIDYVRFYPHAVGSIDQSGNNGNSSTGSGSGSIEWNGNSARGCDFSNNDFANVRSNDNQCEAECYVRAECTHYSWNTYAGGTCWLKKGSVSKSDAFKNNDPTSLCGIMTR